MMFPSASINHQSFHSDLENVDKVEDDPRLPSLLSLELSYPTVWVMIAVEEDGSSMVLGY